MESMDYTLLSNKKLLGEMDVLEKEYCLKQDAIKEVYQTEDEDAIVSAVEELNSLSVKYNTIKCELEKRGVL